MKQSVKSTLKIAILETLNESKSYFYPLFSKDITSS